MSKLDQSKTPLFSVLKDVYAGRDILPFHVPGHKRGKGVDKEFYDFMVMDLFPLTLLFLRW